MSLRLGTTLIAGLTELSEMANTDLSNLSATGQAVIDGKASTSLSNLTSTGKNISTWSTNISNCITEIPQDIKLELSDGTLTLKAGSKVYVPNGSGVFDIVTVTNDIVKNDFVSGDAVLFLTLQSGNYLFAGSVADSGSGTSTASTNSLYYRTDLNAIYPNNNTSGIKQSFPIAIITVTSGVPTSIDQVFNGFGYIGSTIFALSGVKGLVPKGISADGTLRSSAWETSSVITRTFPSSDNYAPAVIVFTGSAFSRWNVTDCVYHPDTNKIDNVDGTYLGAITLTSGVISNWNIMNQVFHAIDFRDSGTISGWSMPSDNYENLTLGATDTLYTAPTSGWVALTRTYKSGWMGIILKNKDGTDGLCSTTLNTSSTYQAANMFIPVLKGEKFSVSYSATFSAQTSDRFQFIYAKGEV